ncbi:hypothetical protein BHE74_00016352 [Ensete ventricosum]|nr:hypothetical protein BHE74_00016352 [Ensete ventricosum]
MLDLRSRPRFRLALDVATALDLSCRLTSCALNRRRSCTSRPPPLLHRTRSTVAAPAPLDHHHTIDPINGRPGYYEMDPPPTVADGGQKPTPFPLQLSFSGKGEERPKEVSVDEGLGLVESCGVTASFLSLFVLLLLHLGCFFFSCSSSDDPPPPIKRRKISPFFPALPVPSDPRTKKPLSIRSYLSRLLSFRNPNTDNQEQHPRSPIELISLSPDGKADGKGRLYAADHRSLSYRDEIYPCPACGEVLSKPQLLDLHHAAKHSFSELRDADSGYNIFRIIFRSGWIGESSLVVRRILKIHNTARTLARYEEYRDAVRSRAARYAARNGGRGDGRCIADGNERLRFYCTTILCSREAERRGGAAPAGACGNPYCCACAIVRHGFAGKHADLDGIATYATSWGAHASLPEDLEREFAFLGARRAMLVCRVVAGRVAHGHGVATEEEEKGAGFDSVVANGGGAVGEDELLVYSPRAVLPCFVVVYTA